MTDAEVKNVEIGDQVIQERDEITANLTVGVPVLADDEFRDGISIQGDNVDLEDRYANIDLSVTLSVEESQRGYGSVPTSVRTSSGRLARTLFQRTKIQQMRYGTFTNSTIPSRDDRSAGCRCHLSETVRRYMVEYDIHDPSDTKQVRNHTALDQNTSDPSSEDLAAESGSGSRTRLPSKTGGDETTGIVRRRSVSGIGRGLRSRNGVEETTIIY